MELANALAALRSGRMSTAMQRVNHPIHKGAPNPKHGKIFLRGSVPAALADAYFNTEEECLAAVLALGATDVQGVDCRWLWRNGAQV